VIVHRFPILAATLLAIAAAQLTAQRPERQQELLVPGTGATVKAGWRLFVRDECRFAVPVSWVAAAGLQVVLAPEGAASLSVSTLRSVPWSLHKARTLAWLVHPEVREDSTRRLWLEMDDGFRTTHYVSIPNGSDVCSGVLEILTTSAHSVTAMIDTIAHSIGPAPVKWPPDFQ